MENDTNLRPQQIFNQLFIVHSIDSNNSIFCIFEVKCSTTQKQHQAIDFFLRSDNFVYFWIHLCQVCFRPKDKSSKTSVTQCFPLLLPKENDTNLRSQHIFNQMFIVLSIDSNNSIFCLFEVKCSNNSTNSKKQHRGTILYVYECIYVK